MNKNIKLYIFTVSLLYIVITMACAIPAFAGDSIIDFVGYSDTAGMGGGQSQVIGVKKSGDSYLGNKYNLRWNLDTKYFLNKLDEENFDKYRQLKLSRESVKKLVSTIDKVGVKRINQEDCTLPNPDAGSSLIIIKWTEKEKKYSNQLVFTDKKTHEKLLPLIKLLKDTVKNAPSPDKTISD